MPISSSDVPTTYDVVFSNVSTASSGLQTFGFVFADSIEPSLPFRTHRAIYDITPTFIARTNATGVFGDNQQDFWMTWNQEDWSLGEDQKFFRINDADRIRRYWQGTNVDARVPGEVTIRPQALTVTLSSVVNSGTSALTSDARSCTHLAGAHDMFEVSPNGTFVSRGEHGLGVTPAPYGMAFDGKNTFLSSSSGVGASAVRSWSGTAYSTFSPSAALSLAFLNNTLYGYRVAGDFGRYDTAGVFTSIFTWKDAKGNAIQPHANAQVKMAQFGTKLIIMRSQMGDNATSEVWSYDGAVSRVHQFEENFVATDIEQSYGVLYVSGQLLTSTGSTLVNYPCIFYIANGTIGLLWKSQVSTTVFTALPLTSHDGGLAWPDYSTGSFVYYNPGTGGISRVASIATSTVTTPTMIGGNTNFIHLGTSSTADLFPNVASTSASATLTSSLYDFDNSLDKVFRSVKIEFASATDGNGGSIDISFLVGDVTGTFTNLQTTALSGIEYFFPAGTVGRNITIKLTLNKGTSTGGPVLRRLYVRGAPLLQTFRSGLYIFDLSDNRELRDGSNNPVTSQTQMQNLFAAAKTTTPFSITDKGGSFTGLVDLQDPDGFDIYEIHPIGENQPPGKAGTYLGRIKVREV